MVTLQEKFIMSNKYRSEALTQHADQPPDPATGARAVSIYQTTCYVFENAQDGENQLAMKKPGQPDGNVLERLDIHYPAFCLWLWLDSPLPYRTCCRIPALAFPSGSRGNSRCINSFSFHISKAPVYIHRCLFMSIPTFRYNRIKKSQRRNYICLE